MNPRKKGDVVFQKSRVKKKSQTHSFKVSSGIKGKELQTPIYPIYPFYG
jgi:hypothetical protein